MSWRKERYFLSDKAKAAVQAGRERRQADLIARIELVPNAPFRERYLNLEAKYRRYEEETGEQVPFSAADIARKAGLVTPKGKVDSSHVKRLLGLKPRGQGSKNGREYTYGVSEYIQYDTAVKLARAMDMDPVEAGV